MMENYHSIKMILDFLSSISWPLITIIIFLVLKNPISNFINNIKKFTYGSTGIETNSVKQNDDEDYLTELLGDGQDASNLDKVLAKFSEETLSSIDNIIESETQIIQVEGIQNKYDRIYKYAKLIILIKNAEKIYSLIYGSQIRMLQRLNYSHTETKEELKLYYENASKNNPEGYKNYPYDSYLNFLIQNGLISIENENVSITYNGRDFLRYIVEANLTVEKFN